MARIAKIIIKNYRSVGPEPVEFSFPENRPVVLIGENNAGKSNIVKAIELVMGEFWPGSHKPDDHEFFGRSPDDPIEIEVRFTSGDLLAKRYSKLQWSFDPQSSQDQPAFGGFDVQQKKFNKYVSNEQRDECICIAVGANRNLNEFLSYRSKWTLLSRLMKRFHDALNKEEKIKNDLEEKFGDIKLTFHKIPSFSYFVKTMQKNFEDLVGSMTHRLQVDFEAYNPVNFFQALNLQAVEENKVRTFDELGTGEQQVLAISFAHAYATAFHVGILLIIEEPEAHLHPLMQQWLSNKINRMAADGLQILITTHSPAFLNVLNLEGTVLVTKYDGATRVKQVTAEQLAKYCVKHGAPQKRTDASSILPYYAGSATRDILAGLFGKKVVLVEGPTESLTLPIYLAKVGMDVVKEGIAIIPVWGKGNLAKWWRFFTIYDIPTYFIFDNDEEDDKNGNKRIDALSAVGVEPSNVIKCDSWEIYEKFSVFGKDFENALRGEFPEYSKLEAQARQIVGDSSPSKPLIARYVAEQLKVDGSTGWEKIQLLKKKLEDLATS